MPADLGLNFTPLTNPTVWFASVDAFNAWVGGITVSITVASLPVATTATVGAVKVGHSAAYDPSGIDPSFYNFTLDLDGDGVAEQYVVPSQARFLALEAEVAAIKAALVTAGSYQIP